MNIKTAVASIALATVLAIPSLASAHTVLGETIHGSVSVGSVEERTLDNNPTNNTSATIHIYSQINHRVRIYGNGTESLISRNGNGTVSNTQYNALTGSLGVNYMFNNRLNGTVEGGNRINDQLLIPGANKTIPYVGASLTLQVF